MDNKNTNEKVKREKSFSNINAHSFVLVVVLLTAILFVAGVMSYFIPQGDYQYDQTGAIIPGTYTQGSVNGIELWKLIAAPFLVFTSSDSLNIIMISLFLLVMSGVFNVMEKTGGVIILIRKSITKFASRKKLVVCICVLFFMLFGSFFGMFEELVTLLPLIIVFMLSLGYDTMTGLGVCMLAACFGFSAAITNPFSVGLAAQIANVAVFEGVWLRLIFFATIFVLICGFLFLHIKKISHSPQKSPSFDVDRKKLENIDFGTVRLPNEDKIFRVYAVFFSIELIILIVIASVRAISGFAIPILAVSFLIGGLLSGCLAHENKKKVFKAFIKGAVSMLPAVAMIALASSVKFVLDESGIIGTIMHGTIDFLSGKSKFVSVLLIYFLILFLQIFIGSASAKIMLIMPIIIPICTTLGISPATIILTYCMADGFTDMILPTNPVLLIGLSMANVSYGKWIKWTWLLQLIVFMLTLLFLFFAVSIGY